MRTLDQLQQHFSRFIYDENEIASLQSFIQHKDQDELTARLSIYKNNIYSAQIDSMKNTFPTILQLVGDNFFTAACREYLSQYPNADQTMLYLGQYFSQFIAEFKPAQSLPYLSNVAQLEWLEHESFHAKNIAPIEISQLQQYSSSELAAARIIIHPSARLLNTQFACWQIRKISNGATIDDFELNSAEHILICRPSLNVLSYLVSGDFLFFLKQLLENKTLENAIESTNDNFERFKAAEAIQQLIQYSLIIDIKH